MNPWLEGTVLAIALTAGGAVGWVLGSRLRLRLPNAFVTTLVLAVGSLGGPVLTYRLMGPGLWSYILALLLAGVTAGIAFWPMGERQGTREWL
ncbi:MAG TPA: hypothetical protein VFU47_12580 [Armatimonadota bacterium]|nr:hypothetical protein [Armatimonadota bacterium]